MTGPGAWAMVAGLTALLLSLLFTPLVRRVAIQRGFLDHPGERKVHRASMPTGGGVAVAIAFFLVLWSFSWLEGSPSLRTLLGLTWAGTGALVLGLADDRWGVPAWAKLAVQAGLAIVLHTYGFGIDKLSNPFGEPIRLAGGWDLLAIVVWVLAVTNAINLIDGLDGLAAGVVAISTLSLIAVAAAHQDHAVVWIGSILAGATLGFLRHNFPPARIFLGDTGSQFLGTMMAALALLENQKGTAAITLLLPIVAMGLPIVDSVLAFLRRLVRGGRIFRADQEHLHHRLLHLGLTQRQVVILMYYCCSYLGLAAYVLSGIPRQYEFLVLIILGMGLFLALEALEFMDRRIHGRPGT